MVRDRFLAFASPAFRIARADGTGEGRHGDARQLPTITAFSLDGCTVVQDGDLLTARSLATIGWTTPEGKADAPGPAPRPTSFHRGLDGLDAVAASPSPANRARGIR